MSEEKSLDAVVSALRKSRSAAGISSPAAGSFDHLTDESVVRLYESIRRQVEADKALGHKYRLVGAAAKERAGLLGEELLSRGLKFAPIVWS
ncbi:hypothetical protein [Bradyrhizobium daqingense]|uniref:hypothetical protein n=1 Tax=Bradyrhizobium daqingense TaxID=993502 RepID=UPI0038330BCB